MSPTDLFLLSIYANRTMPRLFQMHIKIVRHSKQHWLAAKMSSFHAMACYPNGPKNKTFAHFKLDLSGLWSFTEQFYRLLKTLCKIIFCQHTGSIGGLE